MLKKLPMVISVVFNVLFVAFIVFSLSRNTAAVSFLDLDTDTARYTTGVCAVSVPSGGDGLVFGPVAFSLRPGEQAALQFSLSVEGRPLNLVLEPLYDHDVVTLTQTGYGLLIHAQKPGTTVLQTAGEEGFSDIATITVIP